MAEPQLLTKPEMKVIGIEVRTKNAWEMDPKTAKIAALWERFFKENIIGKIPNKTPNGTMLGVYTSYESDHNGMYSLIAGAPVERLDNVPKGLVGLSIPSTRYLVFPARGEMPQALIETWTKIWNYFTPEAPHKRAYTTDYEWYDGPSAADIHIALR